jgi:hypothetical protein
LCASALARTPAVAARQAPADSRTLNHCCCAADDTSFGVAPIETQPLDAAAAHKNTSAVTRASVDAGSMPTSSKRKLPPGVLKPKTKNEVDRSIEKQRKAIEAEYGGPTKLLPRAHKGFFASIDASNVHLNDERLTSLSLEDASKVCPGDGGRGTNRTAVRQCLRDRIARATKKEGADANEVEKDNKRVRGEFPYEFAGLGRAEKEEKWRELLVIPGSCELAMGQTEFVKRTGGSGGHFWTDLQRERAAAMADEARRRGDVKTSVRQRTHTASSKCGR